MDKLRKAYRVSVIIGLAMMASLVVYLVVVSLIENGTIALRGQATMPAETLTLVKFVLLGISVFIFLFIRTLNGILLRSGGNPTTRRGVEPRREDQSDRDPAPLATTAVVTYALCEAPAIFGLVLYFLGRDVTDFYLFLVISFLSFSVHFPKFSRWQEWARQPR